ncbi:MAG: M56 family metallopeptidase [Mycobacteriales bacterium]
MLVLVVAYTGLILVWSPRLLANRTWAAASPRLGLLCWQSVLAVLVSNTVLVAAMAVVSVQHLHLDVGHLLHACAVSAWRGLPRAGVAVTTGGGLLGVLLFGQLIRVTAASVRTALRLRRHQRAALHLLGGRGTPDRVTLLTSDEAFAYCVPGDGGRIVISTTAASELEPEELRAVVAHERAHLRGRHDLVILLAQVVTRALPLRSLQLLQSQVATLLEMVADDRACRVASREALLSALLTLAAPGGVRPGLAVDGGGTVARALRLADPPPPQPYPLRIGLAAAALAVAAAPWLLGGAPVLLALTGHCDG